MKFMFSLLIAAFGFSSFANAEYVTEWPQLNGVPIHNLCVEGDDFRSIDPVRVCTAHTETRVACVFGEGDICRVLKPGERAHAHEFVRTEVKCTSYESETVEFPRSRTVSRCVEHAPVNEIHSGECLRWTTVREDAPLTHSVDVYRNMGNEIGKIYSHSFYFTIPQCD